MQRVARPARGARRSAIDPWMWAAAVAVTLTACGGGGTDETPAPASAAPVAPAPAPAPVAPKQWRTAAAVHAVAASVYADTPRVAMDPAGHVLVVFARYEGGRSHAMAQRYDPATGQWSVPEAINTGEGNVRFDDLALAVDDKGNAIALWAQDGDPGPAQRFDVWTNRFDAASGSWGTATLLETDDTGLAVGAQVAFDGLGNAFAVWQSDGDATANQRYDIWAARWDAARRAWDAPTRLETDAGSARAPQVAAAADGTALVVWSQDFGTTTHIRASRYAAGGVTAWSAPASIATFAQGGGGNVRLAMNPAGQAVAVWESNEYPEAHIGASRFDAVTAMWSAAVRIDTVNLLTRLPRVSIDRDGNVLAAWQELDGRYSLAASRYSVAAGTWSPPELIERDDVGNIGAWDLAGNAAGETVVVWQASDGTLQNVWANRFTPGSGWGEAAPIETTSIGHAQNPTAVISATGVIAAVWSQADGTASSSLWANWFR